MSYQTITPTTLYTYVMTHKELEDFEQCVVIISILMRLKYLLPWEERKNVAGVLS